MSKLQLRPTLERLIAEYHVNRALRPYRRAQKCLIVLAPPLGVGEYSWKEAAIEWSAAGECDDIDPLFRRQETALVLGYDALEDVKSHGRRFICIVNHEDRAHLLHPSVAAADAIIKIDTLDPALVRRAVKESLDRDISLVDAEKLATLPCKRRRLISNAGRALDKTIANLADAHAKALAEEEAEKAEKSAKKSVVRPKPAAGPHLEDLHGYGEAKSWGLELARDLADYKSGSIQWDDVDNGLLLSGPPGVGKTTFASALAQTCGIRLVTGSYATWQSHGHQGDMLKAMHRTFEDAHKASPCVLLIDEIDSFVDREAADDKSYMRGVVNGLLELLDGAGGRKGIVVIGACNNPKVIDPALRRAGRLDRHIEISLPDEPARIHILRQHLNVDLDLRPIIRRTEGMSGADLERVARDARRLARRERVDIGHRHVAAALPKRVKRSDEAKRVIALHELGHAVVNEVLQVDRLIDISISPDFDPAAGAQSAGVTNLDLKPLLRRDRDYFAARLCVVLAGMAAEQVFLGSHGDGVIEDLRGGSNLATYTLVGLGMGGTLVASGGYSEDDLQSLRRYDARIAQRVDEMLQDALARARGICEQYRDVIEYLADGLVRSCRLDGSVVTEAVRRHRAPAQLSLAV